MAPTNFKVLTVVGGTGEIGSHIVRAALKSQAFDNVFVFTRTSSLGSDTAQALKSGGATLVPIDDYSDHPSLVKALKNTDAVIVTLGQSPAALTAERQVLAASLEAGVKRFVPSEFGVDHSNGRLRFHAPVRNAWDDKTEVFEEVKKSGIEWTAIVNGCFLEASFGPWFGFDLKAGVWNIKGDGKQKATFTSFVNVASSTIQSLLDTRFANRTLIIAGDVPSLNEVIAAFENAQGKTHIKNYTPIDEAYAQLRENYTFEGHLAVSFGDGSTDYSVNDNEEVNPDQSLWKWDKVKDYAIASPFGALPNP